MVAQSHDLVGEVMGEMTVVELDKHDPDVERLVQAYRDKYAMGPRDITTERALLWRGVQHQGRTVAVFGELLYNRKLELTDAYREESPIGLIAYAKGAFGYLKLLYSNTIIDELWHTTLYENTEQWKAVIQHTHDVPYALTFRHVRKEQP